VKTRLRIVLWVFAISLLFCTVAFYALERGTNDNINTLGDAFWWFFVTTSTVGYGDIVPSTSGGRLVAIVGILIGFYLFTNLVAIITESVQQFVERRRLGLVAVHCKNHIVVCDYTAVADEMLQSMRTIEGFEDREVVIVTDLVQQRPYSDFHFVRGVPFSPEALKRANTKDASYVLIFANFRFADPDLKTLHIASRILDINPDATILIEMIDPKSELLGLAKGDIIPMDSRRLIEQVLKREPLDPREWLQRAEST